MDEPSGLDILTRLLESVRSFASADPIGAETPLDEDVTCQVGTCVKPAVFQCTAGYQYCAHHAGRHGIRGERHEILLLPLARRELFDEARATLEARIAHPENEPVD